VLQRRGKVGPAFHAQTKGPIAVGRNDPQRRINLVEGTVGNLARDLLLYYVNTRRSLEGPKPQPEHDAFVDPG